MNTTEGGVIQYDIVKELGDMLSGDDAADQDKSQNYVDGISSETKTLTSSDIKNIKTTR